MFQKNTSSSLNVLVVDDAAAILSLVKKILNKLGYRNITTAINGKAAINSILLEPDSYDIIICDLNMPEVDGVELLKRLAKIEYPGGIIILSGEGERLIETVKELAISRNLNVIGTIIKPFKPEDFQKLLGKYKSLERAKADDSTEDLSEKTIRKGLKADKLQLYFQPKINISTRKISGVEILVRYDHPTRGMVKPGSFIPLAEKSDLINDLTYYVYKKAMEHAGKWLTNGTTLDVSINIPVNLFSLPQFTNFLITSAQDQGVDQRNIILELTESQIMKNVDECLDALMRLQMNRFGISIDDFGTGHSTMKQLKRIPFTELKIDRTFVTGATHNTSGRAILESCVLLAKKLKMDIVAEGVETKEDWQLVKDLGCHYAQGFYIAKAMQGDELIKFMNKWNKQR